MPAPLSPSRLPVILSSLTVALAGCGGCKGSGSAGGDAAGAGLSSSSGSAVGPRPPVEGQKAPCRAISVVGRVAVRDGAPLSTDALIPDAWLDMTSDGHFTAKHPRTTRETTFIGPGGVRVCVNGDEEAEITTGTFTSSPGAGEAPGMEQWVLTPLGAVRYVASATRIAVTAGVLDVRVQSGSAYVYAASDVKAQARALPDPDGGPPKKGKDPQLDSEGWYRVDPGDDFVFSIAKASVPFDMAQALERDCAELAKHSHDLAYTLLHPYPPPTDGAVAWKVSTLSKDHVLTRRKAHGACGTARVRAWTLLPTPERAALLKTLDDDEATWRYLGE
jgi:hypothetical protein